MPRARCCGHHGRGPRLGVTTPHCVFPTCAGCQVNETTVHRFWHCPYFEDLRPQFFKDIRQELDDYPGCFTHCALQPIWLDIPGATIAEVQKVFVDIEERARAFLETFVEPEPSDGSDGPGPNGGPPPDGGRKFKQRRTAKPAKPAKTVVAPKAPHPPEAVNRKEGVISCTRCGASMKECFPGATIKFWAKECIPWRLKASATRFKRREASIAKAVEVVAERHGAPLSWSKSIYGAVRCRICEWQVPVHAVENLSRRCAKHRKCTGNKDRANKDLQHFRSFKEEYDQRERSPEELENKHDLVIDGYVLYCRKCWVYAAPTAMTQRAKGPIQPPPLNVDVCKAPPAGWKEATAYFRERKISEQSFLNLRRGSDE